ncbi:MAG: ABC transporter permease [Acidobacteria bacterium]|nr:ABC transporter permease [Acidobacteriota bacterium]
MKSLELLEVVKLSISTLLSNKFRSALTILGIIVATTTVIAVSSILTGMNQRVAQIVEEFGTNTVYVARFKFGPRFGPPDEEERKRKVLTKEDGGAIRDLPSVLAASVSMFPDDDLPPIIKYRSQQAQQPNLRGVWSSYLDSRGYLLSAGRFFTQAEEEHRVHVCVIGSNIASSLFPNIDPMEKEITIKGEKFRVIGVMEKTKASFGEDRFEDSLVLIPYDVFRTFYPSQDEHVISARAKAGQFEKMKEDITELLRKRRKVPINAPDSFEINTSSSIIEQFQSITAVMALIVVPISGFGLLVGGVGVMNIMLVSVTERTREIGIRRAIGARRRNIIIQFLTEAMMLTGLGGVIGIIVGQLISLILNALLPSYVPTWAMILGFSLSLGIGLVAGLWPAVKAAYIDPVEALRYE